MASNLSLAKLRRATDPGNVSDYTTLSRLGADCADTTTSNSDVSMSMFEVGAVSSITGNAYVDEGSSNESYTLTFTTEKARFSRITGQSGNFAWSGSTPLAPDSSQDYTATFDAPAITTTTPGGTDSLTVKVAVTFAEDGESAGFNSAATNYNTKIEKTIEVVDTYGAAVVCFLPGTKITLADGSTKNIEDLTYDDKLTSLDIESMPDEGEGYVAWNSWTTDKVVSLETETNIEKIWYDYTTYYYTINDNLKVTGEHDLFVKSDELYQWKKPTQMEVGDSFYGLGGELTEVKTIELSEKGEYEVIHLDVEPFDVYFVNGFLAHNKGTNTAPPNLVNVTDGATSIDNTSFTARGSCDPRGTSTSCVFKVYSDLSLSTLVSTSAGQDAGSGTGASATSVSFTGLSTGGDYWYTMTATNSGGTQISDRSAVVQLTQS
jgi:hypothetical protein|tara:strand:+ start:2011 stop:3312 length:1302 start_codon:yes stop_codon:yes gene_type:complete